MKKIEYNISVLIDDDSLSQRELNEIRSIVEVNINVVASTIETTIRATPLQNFQVIAEEI